MKEIDQVLEHLHDSNWHGIEEIRQKYMLDRNLNKKIYFLEELELISIKNEKLRITSKGLKFLELPI